MAIDGHGTVQVGVIAFSDNSGDGLWDPREYIIYVPEGFEGKELPVLMIYPGNTQTDSIFLDSTLWWQIAEDEGIVLAFVCETYNASPCSVSHADVYKRQGYHSMKTVKTDEDFVLAGRNVGNIYIILSLFASFTGLSGLFGTPQYVYEYGIAGWWWCCLLYTSRCV